MNKEYTKIAIPNGEWRGPFETMLSDARIPYQRSSDRNYKLRMRMLGIDGVIVRASDVPRLVKNPRSQAVAGITGEDILIETGLQRLDEKEPTNWRVPLTDISAGVPRPKLYLGATPNAREQYGNEPELWQIMKGLIVTAYPALARQYCESKKFPDAEIDEYRGSIEGLPELLAECSGVIDVMATGKTSAANGLTIVDIIKPLVELRLIEEADKMSPLDKQRLEDFKQVLEEEVLARRLWIKMNSGSFRNG